MKKVNKKPAIIIATAIVNVIVTFALLNTFLSEKTAEILRETSDISIMPVAGYTLIIITTTAISLVVLLIFKKARYT